MDIFREGKMNTHTNREHIYKWTDGQMDRYSNRKMDVETERWIDRHIYRRKCG